MTEHISQLRDTLAAYIAQQTGAAVTPGMVDCPAEGCGARSAAPLIFHADAAYWAQSLERGLDRCSYMGAPLLQSVTANGGHLLFQFTNGFYTATLQAILAALPPVQEPGPAWHADAMAARLRYTLRRMWMLSRNAAGEIACPEKGAVQRAWLLIFAATEQNISARALELRLLAASDALLTMVQCVPPRQRQALRRQCAYVGDAAARILYTALFD